MQELGRILKEFKKKGGVVLSNTPKPINVNNCPRYRNCEDINTIVCDKDCLAEQLERVKRDKE